MTDNYLNAWVDRVERVEEEQKEVGGAKRDLFSEAKGKGYNVKALRRLIRERKRDAAERDAEEADLAMYRAQIGMAVAMVRADGLSLRQAAKRAGVSKSSVHRALAVPAVSHDPETGEITSLTESYIKSFETGGQPSRGAAVAPSEPSTPAEQSVNADLPSGPRPRLGTAKASEGAPIPDTADLDTPPSGGGERHGVKALCAQADSSADSLSGSTDRTCSVGIASEGLRTVPEAQGSGSGEPVSSPGPLDLDTTIPDFLRRRRA